jgi:hypothetical protein
MRVSRVTAAVVVSAALAAVVAMALAPGASAYGKADQPIAQIGLVQNCMNPSLCGTDTAKGGFGLWVWIEIDAGGGGDAAGAGCGHLQGFGAGGGGFHGPISWVPASGGELAGLGAVAVATDPNDSYYVIEGAGIAIPTTPGHYSVMTAPGIQTQVQVSP